MASRSQRNIVLIPLLRFLLDQKGPIARTPRDQPLPSLSKQLETHDLEKANQLRELMSKCSTLDRHDVEDFLERDLYSWLMETNPAWAPPRVEPTEVPILPGAPHPDKVPLTTDKVKEIIDSSLDPDKDRAKKLAALLGKG